MFVSYQITMFTNKWWGHVRWNSDGGVLQVGSVILVLDAHGSSEQMMMAAMSGLGLWDSSMASGHGGL